MVLGHAAGHDNFSYLDDDKERVMIAAYSLDDLLKNLSQELQQKVVKVKLNQSDQQFYIKTENQFQMAPEYALLEPVFEDFSNKLD